MTQLLFRLWLHFDRKRRIQFVGLLFLMVFVSFAEIISIGSVIPFLGILTAPEQIFTNPRFQFVIEFFHIETSAELVLFFTLLFALTAIIAAVTRIFMLWHFSKLSFLAGGDISNEVYRRTLYQPYKVHCSRNSSEIINGISGKSNIVIYNSIVPTLTIISSLIMMTAIIFILLLVNPVIALTSFFGFGFIYLVIMNFARNQLLINSEVMAQKSTYLIKSLQEGLGGIRDVLIDGSQMTYCQTYKEVDVPLRQAQGINLFISSCPRYFLEAVGMVLIAFLAYLLTKQVNGLTKAIPTLGAFAFGAQRLLPVLQQSFSAWASMQSGRASLIDTLNLLDQPLPKFYNKSNVKFIPFNKSIRLNDLNFSYASNSPFVLKNLNLNIKKGSRIGFIGRTGSGKSTLIDIIMGLLSPTSGKLLIDGKIINSSNCRSWQKHIAHVPQSIFLSDSTIIENIAFGIPKEKIDFNRVKQAAIQAQISKDIESWPKKYATSIGERGIRLSGGQRQRIGIARALYKKADVIIFDEATSALDNKTEEDVIQAINNLSKDLTILIIAHRLSTLKNCTNIVELDKGIVKQWKVKGMKSYKALITERA